MTSSKKKNPITPATKYIDFEGWVKAYRITTDWDFFDYEGLEEVENPYDSTDIEVENGDFEGKDDSEDKTEDENTEDSENKDNDKDNNKNDNKKTKAKDEDKDTDKDEDKDAEEGEEGEESIIGWEKYGELDFHIMDNPAWDEDGHWNYRGEHYARLHSVMKVTTGITNEISISKVEQEGKELPYYIRITAWIKQVTQNDIADGIDVTNVEDLRKNNIIFALLDKDNKIKF